jgi:hypothetical protein
MACKQSVKTTLVEIDVAESTFLVILGFIDSSRASDAEPSIDENASRIPEKIDVRRKPSAMEADLVQQKRMMLDQIRNEPLPHMAHSFVVPTNNNSENRRLFAPSIIIVEVPQKAKFRRRLHCVEIGVAAESLRSYY